MYITFDRLQQQPAQCANFYHTFGFLTVGNIVEQPLAHELINIGFDKMALARCGQKFIEATCKENLAEIAVTEEFPEFSNFFFSKNFTFLYESFLGKSWLYLNSSLSTFSSYVQSWHRDWVGHFPTLRVGYYANAPYYVGGELRYIPGSHKIGDRYSGNLQRALAWPNRATKHGAMNENNFFPENHSYAGFPQNNNFRFIDIGSGDGTNEYVRKNSFVLPHATLKPGILDIAVFDLRGIHTGTIGLPSHLRVMPSAVLCPNPFDETFDFEGFGITQTRRELAEDLLTHLVANDLTYHGTGTLHPQGLEPPISSQHKFKMTYDKPNNKAWATFGDFPNKVSITYDFNSTVQANESKYGQTEFFKKHVFNQVALNKS